MPPVSPPIVEIGNVESWLSEVSAVANKEIICCVMVYNLIRILNYHVYYTWYG